MTRIKLYTTDWCGFCVRAKVLLEQRGYAFEEINLQGDPTFREKIFALSGQYTVPLVIIDGEPIGGYQELARLDRSGALADRLAA